MGGALDVIYTFGKHGLLRRGFPQFILHAVGVFTPALFLKEMPAHRQFHLNLNRLGEYLYYCAKVCECR
jgi:hypothetical protein